MKIPTDCERGALEMVKVGTHGRPDYYESTTVYVIGASAIRRGICPKWRWELFHAATGLRAPGGAYRTLSNACNVARALNNIDEWVRLRRSKTPGKAVGANQRLGKKLEAALAPYLKNSSFYHDAMHRMLGLNDGRQAAGDSQ